MLFTKTIPLLIICLVLSFSTEATFNKKTVIGKAGKLNLIKNGKPNCNIVVPAGSSKVAIFAGKELQKFLRKSFGKKLPLTQQTESNKISIIIASNKKAAEYGIDVNKIPRDGFAIKTIGNKIIIAGQDDPEVNPASALKQYSMWKHYYQRSTLYGVYDFLERFIGVRFYFPGEIGTIIPKHKNLSVPSIDIIDAPDYVSRTYSVNEQWMKTPKLSFEATQMRRLNTYRLRYPTDYIPNCHGLNARGYLKRFGKIHPEYFALMSNGKRALSSFRSPQLCYKSGIVNEIFEDAKAFLTGKSAASRGIITKWGAIWGKSSAKKGYYNIMPQDSLIPCQCPKCKPALDKGPHALSNSIWDFFIDIAVKLKKEGIPGYITTMAYAQYKYIPKRDMPDNLIVKVAVRGPWQEHLPKVQKPEDERVKRWSQKVGGKLELWNYANKFSTLELPGIPSFTPRCIGSYYKKQKDYILGAYMESESDSFYYHYLNYYVFEKVCWDTSTDVEKLLNEHYQLMYGSAAKTMKDIFETFERKWTRDIFGTPYDTPLGPKTAPASDYKIWEHIYSPKVIKNLASKFKKAENAARNDKLAVKRIKFMREQFLKPLQKASDKYFSLKNAIDGLSLRIPTSQKEIIIDGKFNDSAWQKSAKTSLAPFKDNKGMKVSTRVKILRTADKLYLGFVCNEPFMNKTIAGKRSRDDASIWKDNSVEIFLNPSGDQKNYYHLIINSEGALSDASCIKKGAIHTTDYKWNSDIKYQVVKSKDSWTVEAVIPLKYFGKKVAKSFPANFCRSRVLSGKDDYITHYSWSPFLRNGFHDISNFGKLITHDKLTNKNLLDNASFENGTFKGCYCGNWYGPNQKLTKQNYSFDTMQRMAGERSLKLTSKGLGRLVISQTVTGLKPNTEYILVYYVKLQDVKPIGKYPGVCANIWDSKNHWFPKQWLLGTMPWTKQVFKFKTSNPKPEKKYSGTFRLFLSHATGTAWFDNIQLYELSN